LPLFGVLILVRSLHVDRVPLLFAKFAAHTYSKLTEVPLPPPSRACFIKTLQALDCPALAKIMFNF